MTKDELIKRLEALKSGELTLTHQLESAKNNLTAQRGAIQECQFWIEQSAIQQKAEEPSYPRLKAVEPGDA